MKSLSLALLLGASFVYATDAHDSHAQWKKIQVVQDIIQASHRLVDEITPIELKQKIDDFEDEFVVIDLREPGQMRHGEIRHENFHKIVRGYLELKIEVFVPDKNTQVILYCCSGQRSILAGRTLVEMGYKNVSSLKGGVQGWVSSGMPLNTHYGEMIAKPKDYLILTNDANSSMSKVATAY